MAERSGRLRVVVATPLAEAHCELIERLEPRIDLIRDQSLYPPMRHAADFSGDPSFARTPSQQQAFEAMVDSAEALYGIPDVDPAGLKRTADANLGLRWVQTMAAGGGGQVKAAGLSQDQLRRITFTTSAGVHGGPLAEFAVFGLFAGAKDLSRLTAQQRDRSWTGRWEMRQVSEMTVLVVGLGGIGKEVVKKLAGLGATVIGTSRHGKPVEHVDRLITVEDIVSTVPEVDAIVLTLPGTAATDKLIGADVLAAVKPGTILVNVGRGTVVDEDALLPALRDGRIGFAALDVFATEPLPASSPLWAEPNLLVSPHTGALNSAEDRLIAELFADNATRLLDGDALINKVDTVDFY
ncbi:D-2-hydroxyacid dehydrogenase [uncultured Friedmanniella sp.]|uniref:D-2-hydroxyacid dehydrogenase n=1 Tax=uncultured Friedmanniella sp. TaxID=335381 RepID=UPI0035CB76CF